MRENVLVLVVEGLQAAMLGPYGNTWNPTPHFNRLAAESLLLDNCWSESLQREYFYQALWSGLPANVLQQLDDISLTNESLVSQFKKTGLQTIFAADDERLFEQFGAAQFTEQNLLTNVQRANVPPSQYDATNVETESTLAATWTTTVLADYFAEALDLLEDAKESPFALWLHNSSLLKIWDAPYEMRCALTDEEDPDPPHVSQPPQGVLDTKDPDVDWGLRVAYAAQVQVFDHCLGTLLEMFEEHKLDDSTWLVFISPSGYATGQHGFWGSETTAWTPDLYRQVALIRPPRKSRFARSKKEQAELVATNEVKEFERVPLCGTRISSLTQTADVGATLAEIFGLNWPTLAAASQFAAPFRGISCWPAWHDLRYKVRDRLLSQCDKNGLVLHTPAWIYVSGPNDIKDQKTNVEETDSPTPESVKLFVQPDDFHAVNDVADRCPHELLELAEVLTEMQSCREQNDFSSPLKPLSDNLLKPIE